jgi:hypothetical protein
MMLRDLIAALEAHPHQQHRVPVGFNGACSYRGFYTDLAFIQAENVTVAGMLADARGALGETFQGYKGGDYTMDEYTDCWLVEDDWMTGESIGPVLVRYMLEAAQ